MYKEELNIWNWERILIGDAPPEFLLETLLRTIIVYLFLIFILRLLGKRMNAQLSLTEMAVMITLGAIVAPAMQIPARGILPTIIILCCILLFQRGLGQLSFKNRKAEVLAQGDVSLMVKDGVMQVEEMEKSRISKPQLFGALRTHQIKHLGEVKRAYLESGGFFSVFKAEKAQPGLAIVPKKDYRLHEPINQKANSLVCNNCGYLVPEHNGQINGMTCRECEHQEWAQPLV
ncbi:YetF domain-containing protein [Pontibacter korlensis]|uniref:DUF421 domain-containing protein n=1 Tax=Pontibacter korlensis TaxID=400092 RepID=UPI00061AD603|nr:YetF domain-containing protein [Pontibacter korlensis]